jgi:hypothetical protein
MALACCSAAATWEEYRPLRWVEISCIVFWGSVLSLLYDRPELGRLDSSGPREGSESAVEKAKSEGIASEVVADLK